MRQIHFVVEHMIYILDKDQVTTLQLQIYNREHTVNITKDIDRISITTECTISTLFNI